jgi:hypothetical protein
MVIGGGVEFVIYMEVREVVKTEMRYRESVWSDLEAF